jgi:uncharacterized coiled-coil DUF342 family protein
MTNLELLQQRLLELSNDIKYVANSICNWKIEKTLDELEKVAFKLEKYYAELERYRGEINGAKV